MGLPFYGKIADFTISQKRFEVSTLRFNSNKTASIAVSLRRIILFQAR